MSGQRPGRPLTVHYLLEDTALFGGVKVALAQAELMARRGHRVTVVSRSGPPDWFPLTARFVTLADLDTSSLPPADVTVATFWTTLAAAAAAPGAALHLCQGFEALGLHNHGEHVAIRREYSRPLPAMTVSPHLAELLRREFRRPAMVVPQPLEPAWGPGRRQRPGRPPRLLVTGPFEIYLKGVDTAIGAVELLRRGGVDCHLVRLSQWPLSDEERRRLAADEFHCALPPDRVPELVRGCDLLLAPSWEQEGFGLPALEAMASGVPVVASDVPCYRAWAAPAARLVPLDSDSFAAAAGELLADPRRWRRQRRAGLELARGHREETAGSAVEAALYWAVAGGAGSAGGDASAPAPYPPAAEERSARR